jgi:hypothetical protein
MADHAIVRAGDLLGRKDWVDRSLNRLQAAAPGAWTSKGQVKASSTATTTFKVD